MESNVQPSFIPKKSLNQSLEKPKRSFGLFSILVTSVFVISLALAGAAFGFEKYLNGQLIQKQDDLNGKLENFKPSLIDELSRAGSRIESAKALLQNHFSLSSFLGVLGNATLKTVRFSNFNYTANPGQDVSVSMSGQAKSFMSLALQQLEFSNPKNRDYFKDPILSDFSLDKDGNVTFSFSSKINPKLLLVGADPNARAVSTSTSPVGPAGETSPQSNQLP